MIASLKNEDFQKFPPPWDLKGEGIILVFKFPKKWVEGLSQMPEYLKGQFKGGLGYLMLVNYTESPVGPYRELLLIPGKFGKHRKQSITKIFVDSDLSTMNGRANWGIPKETMDFDWEENHGEIQVRVKSKNQVFFDCSIRPFGFSFPASTALLPINLYQQWEGKEFFTKPSGKGRGKLAKVNFNFIKAEFFPSVNQVKALLAVHIRPFQIHFPKPSVRE